MNDQLLRSLAESIAREQFLLQWPIYAVMAALALVVGVAASYIGAYAKKRGESYATKADFNELLRQLRATTAVAEEVRAQVSHADWAARELKTLRRTKLEELIYAVHEVEAWMEADRDRRMFGRTREPGECPIPKLEVLAGLYFPELSQEVHAYGLLYRTAMQTMLDFHNRLIDAGQDTQARQTVFTAFTEQWRPQYQLRLQSIGNLERQAREIMAELVGA